jgi:hypothetical protein
MVFGSFARHDSSETSDIDVLVLMSRSAATRRVGRVNVSTYDDASLRSMASEGALFILHLIAEGHIIQDPHGQLQGILDTYRTPRTYDRLRSSLRRIADLLDVSEDKYVSNCAAYNDLAIYLLRTALYARFAEEGRPVFSLAAISDMLASAEVTSALTLKGALGPRIVEFQGARSIIEELLGHTVHNRYGSVEALITNYSETTPAVLAFGLRLLGGEAPALGYHELAMTG